MTPSKKILVVDDEEAIRFTLNAFLVEEGYEVSLASNYDEAVALIGDTTFDLMFIDIIMAGKSGIELLRTIKKGDPNAQTIIITGAPSIDTAKEALRLGALDYIIKPIRQNELLKAARIALSHKYLSDVKDQYRLNIESIFKSVNEGIITVDEQMRVMNVNTKAIQLCGFSEENLVGKSFKTLSNGCSGACREILQDILKNKKPVQLRHIECLRKNAPQQIVSVNASPLINSREEFSGCVMALRDETRLYHLEKKERQDLAFKRMIGTSMEMKKIKKLIKTLGSVQTTVLITGESGTGKELAVEALHRSGERSKGPLIKVNCGALAESILESELFGHVQGAFTGAARDRLGRFHLADGGIIFLDEIGDISAKMQLQLLRVIETMSFEQVGSDRPEQVDVRIVAATNQDLAHKVAAGSFREDLYYRLKVVELHLPPLRERTNDIALLTSHMIEKFNRKFTKRIKAVSSDVEKLFQTYSWPGNVRELEHSMEHAFIMCDQDVITVAHLPAELQGRTGTAPETTAIETALKQTDGNKSKAARLLNISRRTIYRKLQKHALDA